MQHFGNCVDWHPGTAVEVIQGCNHPPLRDADAERLRPKIMDFLQVHADRIDLPGEALNGVLLPLAGRLHLHGAGLSAMLERGFAIIPGRVTTCARAQPGQSSGPPTMQQADFENDERSPPSLSTHREPYGQDLCKTILLIDVLPPKYYFLLASFM